MCFRLVGTVGTPKKKKPGLIDPALMTHWATTNKRERTEMHEIICPHCSKAFKIDEAGYADILKQVRDGAFEQQLHERLELAEQDKRNAVELAQAQVASAMQKSAVAKDSEIQALKG